jgi:putative lipoprotein
VTKASLAFLAVLLAVPADAQTITGTATYLARIAMPPDAVFEAVLQDVSKADAPAVEIGRTRIEQPGNPPIRFSIAYDPSRIQETGSYAVRATITSGGRLMFTSDEAYPVLTRGRGPHVAMTLRLAGGAVQNPPMPAGPGAEIETTFWRLARIGDEDVSFPRGPREPHLVFQRGGRVTGADGCNTLTGLYEISAESIRIGPLAGTLMTCAIAKEVDKKFRQAIGSATRWTATPTTLNLLDDKGTILARFDAR